jgi:hypothetical protein
MRSEVLTPVDIKIMVSDVALCSLVNRYQCFRGTHCIHLQGRRVRQMGKNILNQEMEERNESISEQKQTNGPAKGCY